MATDEHTSDPGNESSADHGSSNFLKRLWNWINLLAAGLGYWLNERARELSILLGKRPFAGRHAWTVYLLGISFWLIMILGPSFWYFREPGTHKSGSVYLIAAIGSMLLLLPMWKPVYRFGRLRTENVDDVGTGKQRIERDSLFLMHVMVGLAAGVYFASGWFPWTAETTANSGGLFRHVYMLAGGLLVVSLVIHRLKCVDSHLKIPKFEHLAERLAHADLVVDIRKPANAVTKRPWRLLVKSSTNHLYLFIVSNALTVVLAATLWPNLSSGLVLVISAAAWIVVFSFSFYHRHWDLVAGMLVRRLALGTPGVVSLAVIVLGAGKLLDVDYVTTIIAGSPVKSMLISAYAVTWFYEYWLNRMFFARLNAKLSDSGDRAPKNRLPRLRVKLNDANDPKVGRRAHEVELIGANRFLVTGWDSDTGYTGGNVKPARRVYTPLSFLSELVHSDVTTAANEALNETRQSIDAYFLLGNALLVAFAGFLWGSSFLFARVPRSAIVVEQGVCTVADDTPCGADLGALLEEADTPIAIAVSGGGTRAALHAASFLCGLSRLGQLDQVVLVSSVSGGSAATAYFAMHRDVLLSEPCALAGWPEDNDNSSWARFYRTMSANFISDVMRGVVERRVFGDVQNGQLLAESFDRRFPCGQDCDHPLYRTTNEQTDLGVIFNTTMTGHPLVNSELLTRLIEEPDPSASYSILGGRLVITNVKNFSAYGSTSNGIDCMRELMTERCLAYKTVGTGYREVSLSSRNGVRLSYAAAASANFPPVFSDSGVIVDGDQYWVTDGGALDNRGAYSLIRALRPHLARIDKQVHLVIVDASGRSTDHSQNRGINAGLAAGTHIMSQLLNDELGEPRLAVHSIDIPIVLVTRGGIGTHWKMQDSADFSDPGTARPQDAKSETLSREEIHEILVSLFKDGTCNQRVSGHDTLKRWICDEYGDRNEGDGWWQLQEALKQSANEI